MESDRGPWYRELFESGDYARFWISAGRLPPERTAKEVDFIVDSLKLEPGACLLDLCCGQGRHSVALAARGYEVMGLDLSAALLEIARKAAETAGVAVEWREADMRDVPREYEGSFDAAINMFSAFGYLESDAEDQKVVEGVARSLKPSGQLLMDSMNSVRVFRAYRARTWEEIEGATILTERRFDFLSGRNHEEMTVIEADGSRRITGFSVRQYSLAELATMLDRAGLTVDQYWGDFDGSDLSLDSPRQIVLARKRLNPPPQTT